MLYKFVFRYGTLKPVTSKATWQAIIKAVPLIIISPVYTVVDKFAACYTLARYLSGLSAAIIAWLKYQKQKLIS